MSPVDEIAPPHVLAVSLDEAVEHDRVVPAGGERLAAMGADVPGPAGDEDVHRARLEPPRGPRLPRA